MSIVVNIAGRTETGFVRNRNEDCLLVVDLDTEEELSVDDEIRVSGPRGPLMIVCDGMGGTAGGNIASRLATQVLRREMLASPQTKNRSELARHLRRAVRCANQEIRTEAATSEALQGMGTTVSAVTFIDNMAVVAQVGDSRAYIMRGGALTQITRDQSVVAALVGAGKMTESQAQVSMQRGMILQALGSADDVEVSLSIMELRTGDRVLLCSDGLHGFVKDEAISDACNKAEISEAIEEMLALADASGGQDNVTLLLAEVGGNSLRDPLPGDQAPRFTELVHDLDGQDALRTTSVVAKRLAHKAGLRSQAFPQAVPATGQHPVVRVETDLPNPAAQALAEQSRLGKTPWIAAGVVVVVGLIYLWSRWL